MIKIIDFSKCIESGKIYGDGSTTNKGIIYNDKYYILKYQDKKSVLNQYDHTKLTYFNSIYSEYIACHIGKEIGLNIQETLLGIDDEIPCVACKDFCGVGESIYNFKTVFNNVNKKKNLNFEIDKFMHNLEIINSQEIISKDEIKQYFLDMFVFDAFIGNFDRHVKKWGSSKKEDPSKGFHFVEYVARHIPANSKIAVLLPMQAAIGNSVDVKNFKKKMLDNYTLEAVFSLPNEMFYPGASVIACCMIFDLSQKHEKSNKDTFFGYFKDDKFIKRKGLGRVEQTDQDGNSLWLKTEAEWLDLYKNKREVPGLSVMHRVNWDDEWLAEAYMETDYTKLTVSNFERTIRDYYSYLIKSGGK